MSLPPTPLQGGLWNANSGGQLAGHLDSRAPPAQTAQVGGPGGGPGDHRIPETALWGSGVWLWSGAQFRSQAPKRRSGSYCPVAGLWDSRRLLLPEMVLWLPKWAWHFQKLAQSMLHTPCDAPGARRPPGG